MKGLKWKAFIEANKINFPGRQESGLQGFLYFPIMAPLPSERVFLY